MDERLIEIKNKLLDGEFEKALRIKERRGLNDEEFNRIADHIFEEFINGKKFKFALEMAKTYNFKKDKLNSAVFPYFWELYNGKQYLEAAYLGQKYKIPDQNVKNSAVKAIEAMIKNRDVQRSLTVLEEFDIPIKEVTFLSSEGYMVAYEKGEYKEAAVIANKFGLHQSKLMDAVTKAVKMMSESGQLMQLSSLIKEIDVLNDRTFNEISENEALEFTKNYYEYIVKEIVNKGKLKELHQILDEHKLLQDNFNNRYIKDLELNIFNVLCMVHNEHLKNRDLSKAFSMNESFVLLRKEVPGSVKNRIIVCAQEVYSDLIHEDNLRPAKKIKEEYKLFKENVVEGSSELAEKLGSTILKNSLLKGDLKAAKSYIKEFDIKKDVYKRVARDMVLESLENAKYQEAINIFEDFKLDSSDNQIENAASRAVMSVFDEHMFELASNLGLTFKVERELTREAAMNNWGRYMIQGRYKDAHKIKTMHKLPKDMTEKIAIQVYNKLTAMKRYQEASMIRKDYHISIGFFTLLMNFLKSLFSSKNRN